METEGIRSEIAKGAELTSPDVLVAGISLTSEALRRSLSVNLYDAQLAAVIQLSWGHIAQMQTGEGKTFAAIATAGHLALAGRGVHVMTPNTYLAERDGDTAHAVLSELGMTVGITPEQGETLPKRQAYDCDVTYGTGHEFGFDYLRDQLTLRQEAAGSGSDFGNATAAGSVCKRPRTAHYYAAGFSVRNRRRSRQCSD
jgi:preprotein translocase subunit SecA